MHRLIARLSHDCCIVFLLAATAFGQQSSPRDSDRDGLSDADEQMLLDQFVPQFLISATDCAVAPATFTPELKTPTFQSRNGTIYGQAFPVTSPTEGSMVELHYFHLWTSDCGKRRHPLDAEHVAVLVRKTNTDAGAEQWRAVYWYAAAHEDTVCDISRLYPAQTLQAEEHGPKVWVSGGKHASFLALAQCGTGCGADVCSGAEPLVAGTVVNLGEKDFPMNGTAWAQSPGWDLAVKMSRSDFTQERIGRLTSTGEPVAARNPPFRGFQRAVAVASVPQGAIATSAEQTSSALNVAGGQTRHALGKSARSALKSLAIAFRAAGSWVPAAPTE